jgi:hypothetical protein
MIFFLAFKENFTFSLFSFFLPYLMNRNVDAATVFSVPRTKQALLIGMSHVGDTTDYLPCYLHDVCSIKKLLEERYAFQAKNVFIMYDNTNFLNIYV